MSGEAMGWAIDQDLPAEEKFLLVMIADSGGSDASRQFTPAWAATRCGLDPRRVEEIVRSLQGLGLLSIRHMAREPDDCFDVVLNHDVYVTNRPRPRRDDAKRGPALSFVYIARADHGGCKVGMATDVVQRRRSLEHGAGCAVELIWHRHMPTDAARKLERAILMKFAGQRRYGEWINDVDPDVLVQAAIDLEGAS